MGAGDVGGWGLEIGGIKVRGQDEQGSPLWSQGQLPQRDLP